MREEITLTGFSMAILGIGASISVRTKFKASSVSFGSRNPRAVQCIPLALKYVHGGWKIARSQPCARSGITSPWIWNSEPSSLGSRSQENASWPRLRNARLTRPEYSHPTKTLMASPLSRATSSAACPRLRSRLCQSVACNLSLKFNLPRPDAASV